MGLTKERFAQVLEENEARFREKWGSAAADHSDHAFRAEALNAQARDALDAGDLPAALRWQMQAVDLHPRSAQHHNDLGAILWKLGDIARARASFERALKFDPNYSDARANLAVLMRDSN